MQRRHFITLLGGTIMVWPLTAHAQQPERVRRIGVFSPFAADDPEAQARNAVFEQSLRQLGWTVGQNLQIELRVGANNAERMRKQAMAELAALAPDVLLVVGTAAAVLLLQATQTIPIVFVNLADPVGAGLVKSLAMGAERSDGRAGLGRDARADRVLAASIRRNYQAYIRGFAGQALTCL